jgi:hypothetical protein
MEVGHIVHGSKMVVDLINKIAKKGAKVDSSTLVGGVRGGHDDRVSPAVLLR